MKKNIILIIVGTFIFCTTSNVFAQESYYYKNKSGVLFSYEDYKFISEFFFEGYQEYMSQEDYNDFISSNIMNGEIVINCFIMFRHLFYSDNTNLENQSNN